MANRSSSHTQSPTTSTPASGDGSNQVDDDTSLSLPFHVPIDVGTYYEAICENQPLARRNLIVDQLWLMEGQPGQHSKQKYKFVVARVKHLRGHDISDRLDCLVLERSLNSPIGSLSSSSAKHIVSQCRGGCFSSYFRFGEVPGDRSGAKKIRQLDFNTSSDSNVCLLEELFRLITIISDDSHLYSTNIDASYWFAATIMETAQAIFPIDHGDDDKFGRLKRTLSRSNRPQSECGRKIVAAYRNDKKKNPVTTSEVGCQTQ